MSDRLDLPIRYRDQVEALLREHVPGIEVWAYGSRVNGESHDASDLDLVLRGPELKRIPGEQLADLNAALEDSNVPIIVQVHDWARLPESFHREIERAYVVLVEGKEQNIANNWHKTTLGDLLSFSNGKSSPERSDDLPHPVYGSNGIIGFSDKTNADPNTIIVGRVGTYCGSLQYSNRMCWVTDNAIRANAISGNDAKFIFYLLQTLQLNDWRTGSGQPLLNQSILSSIRVTVPDSTEQRAIAHILGTLDDKIALNRRMNETLEEMARALFKSWFIDFDPVRAKMEGRDPSLPKHLADLFPDRLVDSELGPIPDGWEVKALDEIANFRNGLALQKFRPTEDEKRLPVVKIAQLRSGKADSGEWATENITTECIIDDGDIVFSWSGSLMVKIWCGGRAALNQHLFKVTSSAYPKWFYLHWIECHLSEFQSIAADKATTMGHIKRQHLSEAKCAVPDLNRLAIANVTFTDLLSKMISNAVEANVLANLRDTLLPKLVSGELRVKEAKRFLDKVSP